MHRRRLRRPVRGLVGWAMVMAGTVAVPSLTVPVGAQEPACPEGTFPSLVDGFWVCVPVSQAPDPDPDPDPDPTPTLPPNQDDGPVDPCPWRRSGDQSDLRRLFPDAPPDAILLFRFCPSGPVMGRSLIDGQFNLEYTWVLPTDPLANTNVGAPPPELVAEWLMAGVPVEDPTVLLSPELDVPAIVGVPMFVEVTNWVGQQRASDCIFGVCVEVVATPTLSFDPGESGPASPTVECQAPGSHFDPGSGRAGTPYDPAGAEPTVQAAVDGACAYAYRLRTGAEGRPERWPSSVVVTWQASWSSTVGGTLVTGDFDPIVVSTDVPRQVDEIQVPVVDGSLGGDG